MEATPTISTRFDKDLSDLAASIADIPDCPVVPLNRMTDPSTQANLVGQPEMPSQLPSSQASEALVRVRQAGKGNWLSGPGSQPDNSYTLSDIRGGRISHPVVVTAPLGIHGQRMAKDSPEIARDISTFRTFSGMGAILKSLGYSDREAEEFIDRELPRAQKEIYVTDEGGNVTVEGKVIIVPGKGEIRIQELVPQGYFSDSQVIFSPLGSKVVSKS